ncbi:NADH-quinone oxidoreductase subunit G [Kineosporia sp. J2-2]|uniref:NADH-quinone oxidoreductase subunit G n=1 Tax=Kineosporia corallincola TaxID=2835133 RepID=A0ABS5TBG4_9ACTN|nr:NADH-quinone oxidoreductase subunit G [Kineosporia corallincola]MBT0767774.1 NADH-quinone oxidoreductase subunit G [Kineosporia corallincola]
MTVTEPSKAAVELVTLTIDGIETSVPKGTLLIRAAEELGIAIPRFCDHPLLAPAGACRQCLVEVAMPDREGNVRPMPKPQASCTMTATPGMVVKTQLTSPVSEKAQRGVMELLLINHPLDCPVCDKGGECPLQNQALANGQADSRFTEVKRTFPKPIRISTQVLLDRERCILCQRCTRFSKEIAGDPFIDLQMRGAHQQIGTFSPGVLNFHVDLPDPVVRTSEELEPTVETATQGAPVDESRGATRDHATGTYAADNITTSGAAMLDESGQPFASYFSGNTIQICPVGALTGAAYRFRARPFDLVSTKGVCEHCAGGCALRVDHRRGKVTRRLAAEDPAVNEEWNCDKGRWAFNWATGADRLTHPLVRDPDSGELEPVSWPYALQVAAAGLLKARDAGGVGVLPGGRLTVEDAYAYAKFARVVLRTNDIDFRARAHSAEEEAFLGHAVAGTGLGVTFAAVEAAPSVLLAGLEAEEEAASLFLRLRKSVLKGRKKVYSIAPWSSRGLIKLSGTLIQTLPGQEAVALGTPAAAEAVAEPGSIILVGPRLTESPGAYQAALALAASSGARLAWVPRRSGERGAVEAGALPGLLPGGRPVSDPAARVDIAAAWDVDSLPTEPGRDTTRILDDAAAGTLSGLLVGSVDPDDLPDPAAARAALEQASFVVSLEVRASAVTAYADVVLPVAPPAEKGGTFLNWEGRRREFPQALTSDALSDGEVLDSLATETGARLGLRGEFAGTAELTQLGAWEGARPAQPEAHVVEPVDSTLLSTWSMLLDRGRLQDGEPYLAGTAHRAVARMSPATVAELGLKPGSTGTVTVFNDRGEITLPLAVTPMPDGVVWLPSNSPGSPVRARLAAGNGAAVSVRLASDTLMGA